MPERLFLGLTVLASYIVLGSLLALLYRRRATSSAAEYYVAGYRLGGLLAALTYAATTYSAFMIVGLVGLTYVTGAPSFGFELVYFVATLSLLVLLGPKAWRLARERKWISPAQMIGNLYGSPLLSAIVSLLYLFALLPYIGAQVKGIAEAVAGLSGGENYTLGIVLGLAVILLWTLLAGLWSVAVTDALQGVIMLTASTLLLAWLLSLASPDTIGRAFEAIGDKGLLSASAWPATVFIAYTVPWIFFAATNPQVVQRLFMPRDARAYARMVAWFAFFGLTYTVIVTLVGLLARGYTELGLLPFLAKPNKDAVTPNLLNYTHPLLAALVFTSIVAAAVSTADSIILSVASSIARDLYGYKRMASDRELLIVGRAAIVLLAVLASLIGYTRASFIVALSVLSSLLLLPLAPITIAAWIAPERASKNKWAAYASLGLGLAMALAILLYTLDPRKTITYTLLDVVPLPLAVLLVSTAPFAVFLRRDSH